MEQYSLNLTLEEINKILEGLGGLPYIQVFELISKIQAQTQAQLRGKEARDKELGGEESFKSS